VDSFSTEQRPGFRTHLSRMCLPHVILNLCSSSRLEMYLSSGRVANGTARLEASWLRRLALPMFLAGQKLSQLLYLGHERFGCTAYQEQARSALFPDRFYLPGQRPRRSGRTDATWQWSKCAFWRSQQCKVTGQPKHDSVTCLIVLDMVFHGVPLAHWRTASDARNHMRLRGISLAVHWRPSSSCRKSSWMHKLRLSSACTLLSKYKLCSQSNTLSYRTDSHIGRPTEGRRPGCSGDDQLGQA
jgi:hypothetical protein